MSSFIHLHVHSEYSLLDSPVKIQSLIEKTQALQMPAIALTDHGNILGAVHFYKTARQADVKPIIGAEMYVAFGSRLEKPRKEREEGNYHHLVLLVKNAEGYRNLSQLISHSYQDGFYRKPRIDKELLHTHTQGLVALSACIQGEVPFYFLHHQDEKAYDCARWYREVFGDDYYIEVQNHGLPRQLAVLDKLKTLSRDLSIPLVITNDVHYIEQEDADAREVLICIQTNHLLSDSDRPMKKETEEMYLKSAGEMKTLFPDDSPALDITMDIAAKCNYSFKLGTYYLPEFKVDKGKTVDQVFREICEQGFDALKPEFSRSRYPLTVYEKRLTYEMDKIIEMGFPGYFLIVWDIIQFAKTRKIPVGPGRGSVVGSLVAYVMGITSIDPLKYNLIFERFLNPERISLPDIDIDFDTDHRDQVIQYIRKTYGDDNVAQIVTFGRMKTKLAIRDIGRVLDIKLSLVDKLAKALPDHTKGILTEYQQNQDFQKQLKLLPQKQVDQLIGFAAKLENTVRHTSMHAAGVVIAPRELSEFLPLYKAKGNIVTQFEKDEVEEIGLLKMDILGLKTLTILRRILEEIKEREGVEIDINNLPLDDPATFQVFQNGETDGIFQFESPGMRQFLKRSHPTKIEDLIVLNGLYRPGPLESGMAERYIKRKRNEEPTEFLFEEIRETLQDTYGIIVFQEQVMQISQIIAGFSMAKADQMRKIMGKKLTDEIQKMEKDFIRGGVQNGHPRAKLKELFSQIETFAGYGFNKSHSAAYTHIAYQTAYLKAHYLNYFMCANLTNESSKTTTDSKIVQYISQCKKHGIRILPPSINRSYENFVPESGGTIRFGLKGLKNVGESAIRSILSEREKNGPFKDLGDFVTRIDLCKVNKAVLESLVKAGGLDDFGYHRSVLYSSVEDFIHQGDAIRKLRARGRQSLFGEQDFLKTITIPQDQAEMEEWPDDQIVQYEREISGIYLSYNPVEKFEHELKRIANCTSARLGDFNGDSVRLGGVFTQIKELTARKNKKKYGELFFEDLTGRVKILAFNQIWKDYRDKIAIDKPFFIVASLKRSDQETVLFLESAVPFEEYLQKKAEAVIIHFPSHLITRRFIRDLKKALEKNRASTPYRIYIQTGDQKQVVLNPLEEQGGLDPTLAMKKEIEELTGENSVEIIY